MGFVEGILDDLKDFKGFIDGIILDMKVGDYIDFRF